MGGGGLGGQKPWQVLTSFTMNRGMSPEGRFQKVFPVWSIAVTSNMKQLAVATSDHLIHLYCLTTENELIAMAGHGDTIWQLRYSPDDKMLASTSADGTVRIWEVDTGLPAVVLMRSHANWVWSLAWSNDSAELATGGSDTQIAIWQPEEAIKATKEAVRAQQKLQDNRTDFDLVSLQTAEKLAALATQAAAPVRMWLAHEKSVLALTYSHNAGRLASVGAEGTIAMFQAQTGALIFRLMGHIGPVNSLSLSSLFDGLIATGGDDHTVRLWHENDMTSADARAAKNDRMGANLAHHILKGHVEPVSNVRFHGSLLASAGKDCDVRIWTVSLDQPLLSQKFCAHDSWIKCIEWQEDRQKLFTASTDGLVYVWKVPKKYQEKKRKGQNAYAV